MKNILTYYLLAFAWCASACTLNAQQEKEERPKETATMKIVAAKNVQWSTQYLPTAFHVMRAGKSNPQLTVAQKDSIANLYYPFYYFRATVAGTPVSLTKETMQYMSYGMEQDFAMVVDADTIAPYFSQAIATGNSNAHEFMLAFPRIDTTAAVPVKIIFNDRVFGSGQTYCVFNSNDLKD